MISYVPTVKFKVECTSKDGENEDVLLVLLEVRLIQPFLVPHSPFNFYYNLTLYDKVFPSVNVASKVRISRVKSLVFKDILALHF